MYAFPKAYTKPTQAYTKPTQAYTKPTQAYTKPSLSLHRQIQEQKNFFQGVETKFPRGGNRFSTWRKLNFHAVEISFPRRRNSDSCRFEPRVGLVKACVGLV